MTALAASLPNTRTASPMLNSSMPSSGSGTASGTLTPPARFATPPPPPSGAVPTDFRSSLAAWWNNTSYKDARLAEERLLRRLAHYQPPPPEQPAKGWFGFGSASAATPTPTPTSASTSASGAASEATPAASSSTSPAEVQATAAGRAGESVAAAVEVEGSGLVASLRNVFIPTPNPSDAPTHPADPAPAAIAGLASASSSNSTLPGASSTSGKKGGLLKRLSPGSSRTSLDGPTATGEHDRPENKRLSGLKEHKTPAKRDQGKLVDYINTLEISRPEDKDGKEAVVVLHGYAAALGFFFHNWDPISRAAAGTHRRTFFLDWLGMGLSSRPSPSLLSSPSGIPIPARVARAEHFFLSSLESWRISVGLEKMILVGHSLGGYLASAYAVRYPDRVSGLVLVSPAGIPHGPEYTKYETTAELDARRARGEKEIGVGAKGGAEGRGASPDRAQRGSRDAAADAAEQELGGGGGEGAGKGGQPEPKGEAKQWRANRENSMFRRNATKFFVWGWEKGLSPFTILRSMGPFGPMFAGRYSLRRFGAQSEEDIRDLHGYIYNTSVLKGSGEYCISHILAPGAYARIPIVDRIHNVKVPVTFIYGDNDWMDVDGGTASVAALNKAGNTNAAVHTVKKAGHHVYLDNAEDTNRIIGDAIRAVPHSA